MGGKFRNIFEAVAISLRIPTYILESGVWHLKVHRRLLRRKLIKKEGKKPQENKGLQGEVCHRYNGFLMRQLDGYCEITCSEIAFITGSLKIVFLVKARP